jgi:hypothetical protein
MAVSDSAVAAFLRRLVDSDGTLNRYAPEDVATIIQAEAAGLVERQTVSVSITDAGLASLRAGSKP